MKIQNLAVIFIIIVIPIILVLSYYMSLQRDTINMQASYNTKLLESAIEAFEINTVEWNEAYSETADSKRRDVMAAINTFVTSFANNIGIGGASKEDVLTYIPAIAFIGYDGYYIYAPEEVPQTVKDKDGVTVLYTEKLAGGVKACLGFVKTHRAEYVPNTVLNTDIRTVTKISQQVIATYRRKNSASPYQELVYKAKKIDWDTITFPKEYDYLTKPRKDGA